ncbi:MAG: alpha/beta hydrolase [Pseudobutyrivibrio sp.]|nr:alpha/beta hydrolase [Pseudobutyrivibrio sp.]
MLMRLMPGNSIGEICYNIIVIYLIFTLLLTLYSVIRMRVVNGKINCKKNGRERMHKLSHEGRLSQLPVYTMDEMASNKKLSEVRLTFFPCDNPIDHRFVIVLPGGGYAHCCTTTEGYPVAAKINELGHHAFILEYRTRFNCSPYAPMEDLAKAIVYIKNHQDLFDVTLEDYAICGFSAGGNLAGIFGGRERGYEFYDVPKPKTIILGYPWTNLNHWHDHPYWNIWMAMMGVWLSVRCFIYMFGFFSKKDVRDSLCVQNYIDEDYPDTFMMAGGLDTLVPASRHADVMEAALTEHNVNHIYRKYFRLPHGIGVASKTSAEKWLDEAVEFWSR